MERAQDIKAMLFFLIPGRSVIEAYDVMRNYLSFLLHIRPLFHIQCLVNNQAQQISAQPFRNVATLSESEQSGQTGEADVAQEMKSFFPRLQFKCGSITSKCPWARQ